VVKHPRSIVFYAWTGLAIQGVLVIGVIAFVLSGAAYQRSAVAALHERAQRMQLANLSLQSEFLDAQRALRGFQATGQMRFLQTFFADQDDFAQMLRDVRDLAWRAVLGGVTGQAASAQASFLAGDRAVQARAGSAAAVGGYQRASAAADQFVARNDTLQRLLTSVSDDLAARSERTLGVGLPVTGAVLGLGLMLPMVAVAAGLRWASSPIQGVTRMVRDRALGDQRVRLIPGGPADVRELATAINFLADQSDRLREQEEERAGLLLQVRQVSARIREHLHAQAVIREAVTAIQVLLDADFARISLVSDGTLRVADEQPRWKQIGDISGLVPAETVTWLREVYREKSSYCVQDLHSDEAAPIPAGILTLLWDLGASSLLLVPFGAGPELLGTVTLLRKNSRRHWSNAEIEAAEYLAEDVGRGLDHARLYEGEERLVTELQSLDQAKTSFIAASSHDVRTPLTSILGNIEMLVEGEAGPVPPNQAKMLASVQRNAWRLQTLIEDMLTISKIELGAFSSDLHPMDLAGIAPAAAEIIRPAATDKGLSFTVAGPERGLIIDGDPEQLDRVIMNLLSNAVKYTPAGGRVTLTTASEDGCAVLTVADTGMGIPEEEQGSLFTRFFRASNAVERAIPGSGLGLSIVRTIIANHRGQVNLASAVGVGTTVTVRIPLLAEPDSAGATVPGARRPVPLPRRFQQEGQA
jgi:two-component system, OmpR family, phosphate regulon sensor histidine kinase PhoR